MNDVVEIIALLGLRPHICSRTHLHQKRQHHYFIISVPAFVASLEGRRGPEPEHHSSCQGFPMVFILAQ